MFKFQKSMRLKSQPLEFENIGQKASHSPQPAGFPGSGEKPPNFKPVSRAAKVIKVGPKATKNHETSTLES